MVRMPPTIGAPQAEPPGRRALRQAYRREAIIAIAGQQFLDYGYERTSMSAIAIAMGGSKGTLWKYFSSKEELFTAVVEAASAGFRSAVTLDIDEDKPIIEILFDLCQRFTLRIISRDAIALQRLIIGAAKRYTKVAEIFDDRARKPMQTIIASFLQEKMRIGKLRAAEPEEAADILMSLCAGTHHQRVLWGLEEASAVMVRRDAARAAEMFLSCFEKG